MLPSKNMTLRRHLRLCPAALALAAALPIASCASSGSSSNLLAHARWTYSTDGGRTWMEEPPVALGGEVVQVMARTTFSGPVSGGLGALALTPGAPPRQQQAYVLNDKPVPVPLEGMHYRTIPGIPPKLMRWGGNELTARITLDNRPPRGKRPEDMPEMPLRLTSRLVTLRHHQLMIETGPVVGACGNDFFTVTCRTNMPARVTLAVCPLRGDGTMAGTPVNRVSEGPLIHRFHADGLPAETQRVQYTLQARSGGFATGRTYGPVRLPKGPDRLRFIAMGDSRTFPRAWQAVATAAYQARPDLVLFSGDMVTRGRDDWLWDENFLAAHPEMFARVPFYPVRGNHEERAPLCAQLFWTPAPGGLLPNWAQQVGPALLIGIDGRLDFSPGSENLQWLTDVLAGSDARFIFLCTHYPAWSSGRYGLDEYMCRGVRQGRETIVPLLVRHGATAMIAGHEHLYERSELPGGLTHITTGGAGAPLRERKWIDAKRNPHSRHLAVRLHYCLIEIDGDTCTFQAVGLDGKVFDRRTWQARKGK